jgi:hypothetical protein
MSVVGLEMVWCGGGVVRWVLVQGLARRLGVDAAARENAKTKQGK